jgi:transcriptional regulator with XRE-family HTH domain
MVYFLVIMEGSLNLIDKPAALGSRIRALRKELGLSLEQLAAKSGVALATLSRIENGKVTGTVRTHQKIADVLDIPLPDLYRALESQESDADRIESESEQVETFVYDEKASAILLAKQIQSKNMLPQLIVLEPEGETASEQYRRGTERWIFCLEGQVEISVGKNSFPLSAGATLYFKGSQPHQFRNLGKARAKIISVTSPVVY